MLLAIDIGNSNIVFGINEKERWSKIWRLQTDTGKTADEYEVLFRSLFQGNNIHVHSIKRVVISSVVPSLADSFSEMVNNLLSIEPVLVDPRIYHLLPVKILNPYEMGTDLVANATAAFLMCETACMIIDFGTALTFTTVGGDGTIRGVAITPGLKTAVKSLARNTAQLPQVQLIPPPSVLGENTVHAIQSGIVNGYCGLVKHMIALTQKEVGEALTVIATGGLSKVLAPLVQSIDHIEKNLTLDGLKIIANLLSE